jgi:hypothetical protein
MLDHLVGFIYFKYIDHAASRQMRCII